MREDLKRLEYITPYNFTDEIPVFQGIKEIKERDIETEEFDAKNDLSCNDYKVLNWTKRNFEFNDKYTKFCDKLDQDNSTPDWDGPGWYRFLEPAGTYFERKHFGRKSAEIEISLRKVGMGMKLYEKIFFDLCGQKFKLM